MNQAGESKRTRCEIEELNDLGGMARRDDESAAEAAVCQSQTR